MMILQPNFNQLLKVIILYIQLLIIKKVRKIYLKKNYQYLLKKKLKNLNIKKSISNLLIKYIMIIQNLIEIKLFI